MRILSVVGVLDLGGTERAACYWARDLVKRGHQVGYLSFRDGPRRQQLLDDGVSVIISKLSSDAVASEIKHFKPDIIHAHVPGTPHPGDVIGQALRQTAQVPVVQTNIFGRLDNPKENAWTSFRLFISWTSCVQAAHRAFRPLDETFFCNASVAVYPVEPVVPPSAQAIAAFRSGLGVAPHEVLFGRFSRPEPNKWSNLALDAFRLALKKNKNIKLLLREPPPEIAEQLHTAPDAQNFVILPATADVQELELTIAAVDVVLHTSSIGESFGYGIAEPMNFAKPVITHSVPWGDQAQIELVKHGKYGFVASTPGTMAQYVSLLAGNFSLRQRMGAAAQQHIRMLSDLGESVNRIEKIFEAVVEHRENPFLKADSEKAKQAASYLRKHQFGHTIEEQLGLRPLYYRVRLSQFKRALHRKFLSVSRV